MAYSTILKKKCKCSPNCDKYPTLSCYGYFYGHLPEDLKEKAGTRRQIRIKNQNKRTALTRQLHIAQKKNRVSVKHIKRPEQKPIAKASKKMLTNLKIYRVLKKDYLLDNPICRCGINGCKRKAVDVHHTKGRGIYLNVVEFWLPVARICHQWITDHPKESMELGLIVSRLNDK